MTASTIDTRSGSRGATQAFVAVFAATGIALLVVGGDAALRVLGLALVTALALTVLFSVDRLLTDAVAGGSAFVFVIVAFVWGATGDRSFVGDGFLPALVIVLALGAVWAQQDWVQAIWMERLRRSAPARAARRALPQLFDPPTPDRPDLLEAMIETRIAHDVGFAVALAAIDEEGSQPAGSRGDPILATVRRRIPAATITAQEGVAFALVIPGALDDAVSALRELSGALQRDHGVQLRFGVAAYPDDGDSVERLIGEAEDALDVARLWGLPAASRLLLA